MATGGPDEQRILAGGLVLRAARVDDIEAIAALQLRVFGPGEAQGVRTFLSGPGADLDGWGVVCDPARRHGDHVVSSCALVRFPLIVDGVDVPAGEIEFVATDADHRRRGLVRALMDWHHERSAARGDLVQLISGIPYVYRRFGYGWGLSAPTEVSIGGPGPGASGRDGADLHPDPSVRLRAGSKDDLDALLALEAQRAPIPVRGRRDADRFLAWQWMSDLADPHEAAGDRFFVAERSGEVVGWVLTGIHPAEHACYVVGAAAADEAVADTILHQVRSMAAAASVRTAIYASPVTVFGRRLHAVGTPDPSTYGIYVRVAEPLALLRLLQPVLSDRLARSPMAGARGAVTLSLYVDAFRFAYADGVVTSIERVTPLEDPEEEDAAGTAPDWFPALVLGRFGARALEARVDDVVFGPFRDLFEILFPVLEADVYAEF